MTNTEPIELAKAAKAAKEAKLKNPAHIDGSGNLTETGLAWNLFRTAADPTTILALTDQLATARNDALEEAAKVLDDAANDWNRIRDPGMANNARCYAKKIRAIADGEQ